MRYATNPKTVYMLRYCAAWRTWHNRPLLVGDARSACEAAIRARAELLGVAIESLRVADRAVCIFFQGHPAEAPQFYVNQFKRASARALRPYCVKKPSVWTRAVCLLTVIPRDEEGQKIVQDFLSAP